MPDLRFGDQTSLASGEEIGSTHMPHASNHSFRKPARRQDLSFPTVSGEERHFFSPLLAFPPSVPYTWYKQLLRMWLPGLVNRMVGILVHGDNHFIVRGPLPDRATALKLVRQWSVIQIGATPPLALQQWRISTREFREDLTWAVVVPGDADMSPEVGRLLKELSSRGIAIFHSETDMW
jgi:hypothetical protein